MRPGVAGQPYKHSRHELGNLQRPKPVINRLCCTRLGLSNPEEIQKKNITDSKVIVILPDRVNFVYG